MFHAEVGLIEKWFILSTLSLLVPKQECFQASEVIYLKCDGYLQAQMLKGQCIAISHQIGDKYQKGC